MKDPCMEDQIAISCLKQGDLNGLEILVNRYQARAVHSAYLIVYDRALAEDIVQTAFVKVAERIHQFDDQRPFAPWFFRIVVNDALKLAKKQKRTVSLDEQLDEPTAQLARWLSEPNPHQEQWLEQMEIRQNILKAVESLPPGQRSVIVMRYYLDMSLAEMSENAERPLSTIKWWLRDALARMRSMINTAQGE
jgi:RNA polymerase sigma-70 factor (ECF subfamily)